MFACDCTCSPSASGVSPGEVEKTIGRPVLSIALRMRFDLGLVIRPREVIDFHQIDLPRRQQREDRIVILLRPGLVISTPYMSVFHRQMLFSSAMSAA